MRELFLRIEPRTRSADIEPGLAARVWDAAWLLGRQWVLGEFDGEDAGTPVSAQVQFSSHPLEAATIAGKEQPYDPRAMPLDAWVEGSAGPAQGWPLRLRLESGIALIQALLRNGQQRQANALRRRPWLLATTAEGQPAAQALACLAQGRIPDGEKVYRAVREGSYGSRWTPEARAVFKEWAEDLASDRSLPERSSAWTPERLEYRCALRAQGLAEPLVATRHHGARMDWSSFDVGKSVGATGGQQHAFSAVPTPVRFAGMPEPRYWTFEQAQVDLGSVEASATDLARMAVLQFAFDYGNDAFVLPVRLEVGAVYRVNEVVVTDTFSLPEVRLQPATRVASALGGVGPRQSWSFLGLANQNGTPSGLLFVPPVAAHAQRGADLQDVLLMRDEMANLVWGIEYRIAGEHGAAVDRAQQLDRQRSSAFRPPASGPLSYTLQTRVPENWFALELTSGALPRMLRLAPVAPSATGPAGSLLRGLERNGLFEEEVPRAGLRMREAALVTRWFGGRTIAWRRFERSVGRGEGSSGLQFDSADGDSF